MGGKMLNLNSCGGGGCHYNINGEGGGPNTTPNIWENPTLIGLNRLQPHSRNVRDMSIAYQRHLQREQQQILQPHSNKNIPITTSVVAASINPCICLDSSSLPVLEQQQQQQRNQVKEQHPHIQIITSKKGWRFRLFQNPTCIPQSYILPSSSSTLNSENEEDGDGESTFCEHFPGIPSNWTLIPSHKRRKNQQHASCHCVCDIFDPPRYTNVQMPFHTLYPHVPTIMEGNPTGVYRLEFSLLGDWRRVWLGEEEDVSNDNDNNKSQKPRRRRRRVILHLGGVESCHFIYLYGQFVGMSKDSKLPSEFDVTPLLACNNNVNTLVIIAIKWSDASFLEQQDQWRGMGGIHRSIFLYSTWSEAYVEDVFCKANLMLTTQPQTIFCHTADVDKSDSKETEEYDDDFPRRFKGRIDVQAKIGRGWNERIEGRNIYYNEEIPFTVTKKKERSDDDDDDDDEEEEVVVAYKMLFQLYDSDNFPAFDKALDVSASEEDNSLIKDVHRRFNLLSFSADIPDHVYAWSDESPILYRLEATLVRSQYYISLGNTTAPSKQEEVVVDTFECKIGFRSIEIRDRQLLINGQPVLIKGVNRHDHSPTGGKAVSLDEIRTDLMLMKEYNFNAIRTAHYPNDPYLYDLADEIGLYVVDEANIECHGHYDLICRDHSFSAAMLDRVQRMVVRDQNHPSIIGWSLGNEAGFAGNHTMIYGWVKGYDDSRFVQYEGAHRPEWGQLPHNYESKDASMGTDVVCPMYPSIEEITEWADEIAPRINESRPLIMCEYAHAMGNSSGSLADYWKVIKVKHGLQGAFIWDWIDQGLLEKDSDGQIYFAYGGDYGETPNDANFNINGMIGPDRRPHPAMLEFKKIVQPVDFSLKSSAGSNDYHLQVDNRRYFSTLDDLQGKWTLKIDGFILVEGTIMLGKLQPQRRMMLNMLQLNEAIKSHGVDTVIKSGGAEVHLDITVFRVGDTSHEEGFKSVSELDRYPVVATEQFALSRSSTVRAVHLHPKTSHQSRKDHKLAKEDHKFILSSNCCRATLCEGSTNFQYAQDSNTVIFGMRPNLFRAPTDNDAVKQNGTQFHDRSKPLGSWLQLGLDCLCLDDVTTTLEGEGGLNGIHSTAVIYGQPGKQRYPGISLAEKIASSAGEEVKRVHLGSYRQTIKIDIDGTLFVDAVFYLNESLADLPRVGIELTVPSTLNEIMFFADGPHENYPDRSDSAFAGVYEGSISDSSTYVVPQEQGNRMNLRWLVLTEPNGSEKLHVPKFSEDVNSTFRVVVTSRRGLMIAPTSRELQFTTSLHTDVSLFSARHVSELNEDQDMIYIRIDAAQRGLGSGSCGPQTLRQYKVNGGSYSLSFALKPFGYNS